MKTNVIKCAKLIEYPSCGRGATEKLVNLGLAQMGLKLQPEKLKDALENLEIVLNMDECLEFLGYKNKRKKESVQQLLKNIKANKTLTLKDGEYDFDDEFMISGIAMDMKKKTITLRFSSNLAELFFLLEEYVDENDEIKTRIKKDKTRGKTTQYISYDMIMFKNTNSGFIIRLYEIFKLFSYKGDNGFFIKIEELKKMLYMKNNESYKAFAVFNDKILKPAIEYINKHTDLKVDLDIKKCKKVAFKIVLKDVDGNILLNKNGQARTKTQYKIETIAFIIKLKEESQVKELDSIAMSLDEMVYSPVDDRKAFISLIKNKLDATNNIVTYKQIETLIKKGKGNKDLIFAAIIVSFKSKTRRQDIMSYAYGVLEEAEKDVNKRIKLLNSIKEMRKHNKKEQNNTTKTSVAKKVNLVSNIEKKNIIDYNDLGTLATVIYNLLKAKDFNVNFNSILEYLIAYSKTITINELNFNEIQEQIIEELTEQKKQI